RVSYGLRYQLPAASRVATVPVGYADGVPRVLGERGGSVLVGGRRCPIAGTVTMDQMLVDLGDADVHVDDEVVLLGAQGEESIAAEEWAAMIGTIPSEVIRRFSVRLPRQYTGGDPC